MKRPSLKTINTATWAIFICGLLLALVGLSRRVDALCAVGVAIALVSLALHIILYRCPHCGGSLLRVPGKFCPHCGRELEK